MAEKPASEKTEQPTSKRLQKAREKGQVPKSQELPSVVTLAVLVTMLALMGPKLMLWFTMHLEDGFACQNMVFADSKAFSNFFNAKMGDAIMLITPIFLLLAVGSFFANVAISGLNYSQKALELKFSELNPISGAKKLINARSFIQLATSILKLAFVGLIVWMYLKGKTDELTALRWAWPKQIMTAISHMILGLMIRVCVALLIIAIAEGVWQKWKHIQDLKMTKQEVKEEQKETDGSPELKARIRRVQYETALKRVMQEVPKADIILVNPTHVAVAMKYDTKTMDSPIVLAKGADHVAEKIREIARANGIPIIRRPQLARTIFKTVKEGNPIPENLYTAVAEVLALIFRMKHQR